MTIKVILFGDFNNTSRLVSILKLYKPLTNQSDDISVDTIKIGNSNFLIFTVKDNSLVGSQAAGTNALFYFLGTKPIYKQKQQLLELLNQTKQLDGIPLIIGFENSRNPNLKEIITELQLFKFNRANMVKEIDFNVVSSIHEVFEWIQNQISLKGSYSFNAQPRVVKVKQKYRDQLKPYQKTYDGLIQDRKFKALASFDQQQKYLQLQKNRIKQQDIQVQLDNFSKNKKKITPYDVKPTPNFRIQPNLNFFLKDPKNQKPQQTNIKVQTDQFKPKPPSPKYTPKKVGVDLATQIQQNQLFNFNRQVEPILNILITKTLEFASLQIEEEEQMLKLAKYKQFYNDKRRKQKQHEVQLLKAEEKRIQEKNNILNKYQQKQKQISECFSNVQAYKLANMFTRNLYKNTVEMLHYQGFFPNNFVDQLETEYVDFLLKKTAVSLENLKTNSNQLNGFFDKQVISSLVEQSKAPKDTIYKLKSEAQRRRINLSENQRIIHILYQHQTPYLTNFAKFYSKFYDRTLQDYLKNYNQKLHQIDLKISTEQLSEDTLTKFKSDAHLQLCKNKQAFLIEPNKLAFTIAHNEFEAVPKKNQKVQIEILTFDKNGDLLQKFDNTHNKKQTPYITYKQNLRDKKKIVNMDEGYIIDFEKTPEKVTCYLFSVRINDIFHLVKPQNSNMIKYSTYGLQYYQNNVQIFKESIKSLLKFEDLLKVSESEDIANPPSQSCIIISYILIKKPEVGGWYLQTIKKQSKGMNAAQQQTFKNELINFYKNSLNMDQQDQEQQQKKSAQKARQKSKQESRDKKRKSSKSFFKEEIVKKKKTILVNKCLPPLNIKLDNQYSNVAKLLQNQVNQFQDFIKTCTNGWQLKFRGRELNNMTQIKKFKTVGDIILLKKPQEIIPQTQKNIQEEGQDST